MNGANACSVKMGPMPVPWLADYWTLTPDEEDLRDAVWSLYEADGSRPGWFVRCLDGPFTDRQASTARYALLQRADQFDARAARGIITGALKVPGAAAQFRALAAVLDEVADGGGA